MFHVKHSSSCTFDVPRETFYFLFLLVFHMKHFASFF